jgi:hypothetical protein
VTAQRKSDKADEVIWTLLEGFERGIIELYKAGKYSDAISHAEALVRVSEKAFGRDDPRVGRVLIVLQHVPTAMNRDSQDTPEVRV